MSTLKETILYYGKDKINTLTKYPSILTLHKLGDKGRLTSEFTTVPDEEMFATEKIDGTNVRIIIWNNEYCIGSREFILHYKDELYFDPAQSIVQSIINLKTNIPYTENLTVIYGELYGGKVSSGSKNYGQEQVGFRVFDVAVYPDLTILNKSLEEISRWRETETSQGIKYGQSFLNQSEINQFGFDLVPQVQFEIGDGSHQTILNNLKQFLPETNVALTESALKKPEGIVLRNKDRSKIVKVRYEDYERTIR